MATIRISSLLRSFKELADAHPNINAFGAGADYDIAQNIKYYPYLYINVDEPSLLQYDEVNKYRAIELAFRFRVGDKVNDQRGSLGNFGIGEDNSLDILTTSLNTLLDFINTISENIGGKFNDISLVDDITLEPFFNEDVDNVIGYEAVLVFRAKNDKACINPMVQNL